MDSSFPPNQVRGQGSGDVLPFHQSTQFRNSQNSFEEILKLSDYRWQDIFDFLDDASFYHQIPLVCKRFHSIISKCHTFRSSLYLTTSMLKSSSAFSRYSSYLNIEKLSIHQKSERKMFNAFSVGCTEQEILNLKDIYSAKKISKLSITLLDKETYHNIEGGGIVINASHISSLLVSLPNLISLSIESAYNDICSALDQVMANKIISSEISDNKLYVTNSYYNLAQQIINHPKIMSLSLSIRSHAFNDFWNIFSIPTLTNFSIPLHINTTEFSTNLCKALLPGSQLACIIAKSTLVRCNLFSEMISAQSKLTILILADYHLFLEMGDIITLFNAVKTSSISTLFLQPFLKPWIEHKLKDDSFERFSEFLTALEGILMRLKLFEFDIQMPTISHYEQVADIIINCLIQGNLEGFSKLHIKFAMLTTKNLVVSKETLLPTQLNCVLLSKLLISGNLQKITDEKQNLVCDRSAILMQFQGCNNLYESVMDFKTYSKISSQKVFEPESFEDRSSLFWTDSQILKEAFKFSSIKTFSIDYCIANKHSDMFGFLLANNKQLETINLRRRKVIHEKNMKWVRLSEMITLEDAKYFPLLLASNVKALISPTVVVSLAGIKLIFQNMQINSLSITIKTEEELDELLSQVKGNDSIQMLHIIIGQCNEEQALLKLLKALKNKTNLVSIKLASGSYSNKTHVIPEFCSTLGKKSISILSTNLRLKRIEFSFYYHYLACLQYSTLLLGFIRLFPNLKQFGNMKTKVIKKAVEDFETVFEKFTNRKRNTYFNIEPTLESYSLEFLILHKLAEHLSDQAKRNIIARYFQGKIKNSQLIFGKSSGHYKNMSLFCISHIIEDIKSVEFYKLHNKNESINLILSCLPEMKNLETIHLRRFNLAVTCIGPLLPNFVKLTYTNKYICFKQGKGINKLPIKIVFFNNCYSKPGSQTDLENNLQDAASIQIVDLKIIIPEREKFLYIGNCALFRYFSSFKRLCLKNCRWDSSSFMAKELVDEIIKSDSKLQLLRIDQYKWNFNEFMNSKSILDFTNGDLSPIDLRILYFLCAANKNQNFQLLRLKIFKSANDEWLMALMDVIELVKPIEVELLNNKNWKVDYELLEKYASRLKNLEISLKISFD